jgi:beta-glucosidase
VQWQAAADAFYRASMDTHGGVAIPVLFGVDAVHGDNDTLGATLFPQNSALGATRDPALVRAIAVATAEEVRATGVNWAFAPTLAVPQDDRWGRTYEGYSENPALVAQYASAAVEGLQGHAGTPAFLDSSHVIATAKHFLGDGGTLNGKDQGDNPDDEATLIRIHVPGYTRAIDAGVQSVMASFSSWRGTKVSGDRALLTDVLKQRMGFGGFVVGDWNAHGQVPGCSNEDCPQAINAGMDMFMAPDSWRGLYRHTLAEAKSGVIPLARLDDAVARILRVKFRLGLFEQGLPSSQPLARRAAAVVGSKAHRELARRAVRESLVLLKNRHHLLPIDPRQRILVAGDGADNISKQNGGWTINWQGTGLTNADFPGATSIWAGIRAQVEAAGGSAQLSPDGSYTHKPDVAIVVFGEDPYAEFQGDLPNLAFHPGDDRDLDLLRRLRGQGVPVVAVFLSGRPLWVNREINAADAFVAAWLPGSEGEGVADVLLRTGDGRIAHDFRGKLAYSWPRSAVQTPLNLGQPDYHPQFPYGYGLTYADNGDLAPLPEAAGVALESVHAGVYLMRGRPSPGFTLQLQGAGGAADTVTATPAASMDGRVHIAAIDYRAQEDARELSWTGDAAVRLKSAVPLDLDRQTNGDMLLVTTLRIDALSAQGSAIGVACGSGCGAQLAIGPQLASLPRGQWLKLGIPLKCFRDAGADMGKLDQPFTWRSGAGERIAITSAALGMVADRKLVCPEP